MTWAYPPPAAPPKQQSGHRLQGVTKGSYTDEESPRGTAPHTRRGATYPQDEIATASGKHEPFIKVDQERGESSHHVQLCNLRLSVSLFQKRVKIILRMLLQQTCGFLNLLYLWGCVSFKLLKSQKSLLKNPV